MTSVRKERRQKWWTKHLRAENKPKPQVSRGDLSRNTKKGKRGKHVCVDEGKRRIVKQTLVSSSATSNPSGFRSLSLTQRHESGTHSPPVLEIGSNPLNQSESSGKESELSLVADGREVVTDLPSSTASSECVGLEINRASSSEHNRRYIAFIGNIPFSATGDDVIEHFRKKGVRISEVRLLTKKAGGDSKGCCFAEFPSAKNLQIALKFHHSTMCGRRLNVEVTCGGGGRSEGRMKKIKDRNERLRKAKRTRTKNLKS